MDLSSSGHIVLFYQSQSTTYKHQKKSECIIIKMSKLFLLGALLLVSLYSQLLFAFDFPKINWPPNNKVGERFYANMYIYTPIIYIYIHTKNTERE